jgi:hypothetical protein
MNKLMMAAAAAALCTLLTGGYAKAQGPMGMGGMQQPAIRGIFSPKVGEGADYEMDRTDGGKIPFELSIVGKESVNGKDGYWMETTMDDPKNGQVVAKMLLVVDGANSHAEKMVVMVPGRGAMSMPMAMMGRNPNAQPPKDLRDSGDDLGKESVTTPAGTFNCEHWRSKTDPAEFWISSDVSPYGLVKMTEKDQTIVLIKQVTGVQDKITGPVTDLGDMMRGMRGAPQQ